MSVHRTFSIQVVTETAADQLHVYLLGSFINLPAVLNKVLFLNITEDNFCPASRTTCLLLWGTNINLCTYKSLLIGLTTQ